MSNISARPSINGKSGFNWALYGTLAVQVYIYSQADFRDSWTVRIIVYGLFTLETIQTILLAHDSFHELVLSWGNYDGLVALYYTWLDLPIFTGVISAIIQCFYAWRIYVLGRSKLLSLVIILLALTQCGGALGEGILAYLLSNVPGTQDNTFKTTTVWLGGTALCDIIIATSMVYLLSKSRTGLKRTDTMINMLMKLVLETGLATAAIAVIELSLFLRFKHTFYHIVPALMLSKLYTNSLLVLLNNRLTTRRAQQLMISSNGMSSRFAVRDQSDRSGTIHVNVNEETYGDNVAMVNLSADKSLPAESINKASSMSLAV